MLYSASPFTCTTQGTIPASGAPGGNRDITISGFATYAGARLQARVVTALSRLLVATDTYVGGAVRVDWDHNADASVFDPVGLREGGSVGIDMTQNNTNTGIHLRVNADDRACTVDVRIYTDGGNWSTTTFNLPGSITTPTEYFVAFGALSTGGGSGATYTNVGAIVMIVDVSTNPGTDVDLDLLEAGGYDWEDLPDSSGSTFPVTLAENGPRHLIGDLKLGSVIDAELDGQPSANADGDDTNPGTPAPDDEDGVSPTVGVAWSVGSGGSVDVTVAGCTSGAADLTAGSISIRTAVSTPENKSLVMCLSRMARTRIRSRSPVARPLGTVRPSMLGSDYVQLRVCAIQLLAQHPTARLKTTYGHSAQPQSTWPPSPRPRPAITTPSHGRPPANCTIWASMCGVARRPARRT